jgi:hypothetical protein
MENIIRQKIDFCYNIYDFDSTFTADSENKTPLLPTIPNG